MVVVIAIEGRGHKIEELKLRKLFEVSERNPHSIINTGLPRANRQRRTEPGQR